jgi:hypothetical protein
VLHGRQALDCSLKDNNYYPVLSASANSFTIPSRTSGRR